MACDDWGQPGAQAEQRLGSHWGSRDMKLGRKWKLKADTKVRKGFLGKNWETGVLLCKLLNFAVETECQRIRSAEGRWQGFLQIFQSFLCGHNQTCGG